jgi:hypothetical protein
MAVGSTQPLTEMSTNFDPSGQLPNMKIKVDAFIVAFKNVDPKRLAFSGTRLMGKWVIQFCEYRNGNWQKQR